MVKRYEEVFIEQKDELFVNMCENMFKFVKFRIK